jgi:hypothetical protein
MEYIFGSIVTLVSVMIVSRLIKAAPAQQVPKIVYRQSHIFEMIKPFVGRGVYDVFDIDSQSFNHLRSTTQRVLFTEDRAYWIKNNALYSSGLVGGEIDEENAEIVDTMSLDKVELEQVIFIVEKLTEGTNNDGGNSGQS